ncbi:MAG: nucleotidyltransferase domain-containing protein [Ruminococcus flavefaciens]|nr:nucleotidyltransferase domain-containing protein [Ruminococcus flavefaciens]
MLETKSEEEIRIIAAEIVEQVKALLKGNIYKIVLYGSYARGDFDIGSDINVMIIMNCNKEEVCHYRKQISRVADQIGLENDIEVSLLLRDKDTFERGGEILSFYKNIQQEGIALYE